MSRNVQWCWLCVGLGTSVLAWTGEVQREGYISAGVAVPYVLKNHPAGTAFWALSDPFSRVAAMSGRRIVVVGRLQRDTRDGLPHVLVTATYPQASAYPPVGMRLVRDTDADGWPDVADVDDDNDGMSDAYEQGNNLNPLQDDAAEDLDGDGMSNGDEAVAGTAANDDSSLFRLGVGGTLTGERTLELNWLPAPNRSYVIYAAPDVSGRYTRVAAVGPIQTPTTNVSVTLTNSGKPTFYRARVNKEEKDE